MKLKFLIVIVLLNFSSVFSQEDKIVTLTVSAQGATLSEAKQNALRDAIEQAFGAFISSNTEILNDELVKDEILSVSNGNIQDYEVIYEAQMPSGAHAVSITATVSVNKLSAFVESKGVEVEFKGGLLAVNVKQQILNEKNEVKTIENIMRVSEEILDKSYDFELVRGEPKQAGNNSSWEIPLRVDVKFNKNINQFNSYLQNSLKGLSMSEDEIKRYKQLGKETYKIIIGNTEDVGIGGTIRSDEFELYQEKNPVRKFRYQMQLENYKKWLNVEKENLTYREYYDYVNYYKKSPKRLLHFRTQNTVQLIIDLMYRNQKGFLAYEISNEIKTIKGEDFLFEGESNIYGGDKKTANLIKKYSLKLIGTVLNPILKNHLKQPNKSVSLFEGQFRDFELNPTSGYKSNDYPWYYKEYLFTLNDLYYRYGRDQTSTWIGEFIGVINTEPNKISKQYAFLWEYVHNPEYDNISSAVISLSDFNFTSNTIFSMSLNDILSLSELEKVESYQIYPTHEVSDKSITNSSASKTFKIKIQKNRTNINIRKKPVNGVLVGQVSGGELYTVTNELLTDTPIYLLNNYMVLTDFQTGEKIEKPKDFKLNSVRENTKNTYYAELINTNNTINKVYIEKNKVKIEYNRWYYLEEMKGWIYSVFCEKI
jgi:hypothetical protein